ncbi:hypothetical protein TrST_g5704 [Triparma strigata]|uniref:Uncharacterized protein n=1 Tax=Triparma strigata TaxID=1606541 RepID=A0A9W7AQX3_9STRA|nr:hypothetical protein TrST_g5704 [Triparma strigata]
MSERSPTIEERFLAISAQFETQTSAMDKLTRSLEQAMTKIEDQGQTIKAQGQTIEDQGQTIGEQGVKIEEQGQTIGTQGQIIGVQGERIELLQGEVRGLKEITAARSSEPVQTGKFVRRWRFVFVLGSAVPHGFALASLISGDMRLVAAAKMFEPVGFVCSTAAALGNPRNYGSRKEKLFIGLCSWSAASYFVMQAYASGSKGILIRACCWALICPPSFLGGVKLYSNLSDSKLGAAITALFKSLPGVLIPMLYISAASLRCIMDSTPDTKVDEYGYIERFQALVLYAVTDEEGTELSDFLRGMINLLILNFITLGTIVLYEYIIKPAICQPTTRSSSVTNQNSDAFSFESSGSAISSL